MSEKNITGDKMLSHISRIALMNYRPITADIFLTNYCNNRCPYCTYSRWDLESGAFSMPYEKFREYAERLRALGVKGIILTGGGEPTVCRDFDLIAEYLTKYGYNWGINTNFNVLKFISPNYLKVSLDGWDEESYKARRGVAAYSLVRSNIKKYDEWRRAEGAGTTLGIQMVADNAEGVKRFYEANCDLGVDYISIRPVESTGGSFYREKMASEDGRKDLREMISTIEDLARHDHRVIKSFKWDLLERQEESCTAQWAQIAVNEKGGVMYCCQKPYEIVGHVMDPDILQKKADAVTNMSMCDIPCRMTSNNMVVKDILTPRKDDAFI